jgi:hypothetical protein
MVLDDDFEKSLARKDGCVATVKGVALRHVFAKLEFGNATTPFVAIRVRWQFAARTLSNPSLDDGPLGFDGVGGEASFVLYLACAMVRELVREGAISQSLLNAILLDRGNRRLRAVAATCLTTKLLAILPRVWHYAQVQVEADFCHWVEPKLARQLLVLPPSPWRHSRGRHRRHHPKNSRQRSERLDCQAQWD